MDSQTLTTTCRSLFAAYGAPEELSSDGGPQFQSTAFKKFLENWGVKHRLSSAEYPQSNGRAELAVKTAKRIITNNTLPNGSLDTDKAAQALMQYRNTPLQGVDLSPAQILFHHELRDHVPSNPQHYKLNKQWLISASQREKAHCKHLTKVLEHYNQGTRKLPDIAVGSLVAIQNLRK